MLLDAKLMFKDDWDLAAIGVGNENSDVIDRGAGKDAFDNAVAVEALARGGQAYLQIVCTEDFASGGAPGVTIDLHCSAAEGMTSPDTIITKTTDATPNAGDILCNEAIPIQDLKRYMAVNIAVATAALTAGKVSAFINIVPAPAQ